MRKECRIFSKLCSFQNFIFFPHIFQLYQVLNGKKIIFSFNFSISYQAHQKENSYFVSFYFSILSIFLSNFLYTTKQSLNTANFKFFIVGTFHIHFTVDIRGSWLPLPIMSSSKFESASSLESAMCLTIVPNTCANFKL